MIKDTHNRTGIKPTHAGIVILKVESEGPVCLVPCAVISSLVGSRYGPRIAAFTAVASKAGLFFSLIPVIFF